MSPDLLRRNLQGANQGYQGQLGKYFVVIVILGFRDSSPYCYCCCDLLRVSQIIVPGGDVFVVRSDFLRGGEHVRARLRAAVQKNENER